MSDSKSVVKPVRKDLRLYRTKKGGSIIIHGYIHQQFSLELQQIIPQAIQDLILEFYFMFAYLQWNTNHYEHHYTCAFYIPTIKTPEFAGYAPLNPTSIEINSQTYIKMNDMNIFDHKQQSLSIFNEKQKEPPKLRISEIATATVDYVISSKKYSNFEWEIVVDHIGYHLYIGFIDAPLKEIFPFPNSYSKVLPNYEKRNQYSIKIMDNLPFVRCYSPQSNGHPFKLQMEKFMDKRWYALLKNGDRIRFHVHFESRMCDVYINDVLHFEQFFNGFGDEIIPAVSNSGRFSIFSLNTITPLL